MSNNNSFVSSLKFNKKYDNPHNENKSEEAIKIDLESISINKDNNQLNDLDEKSQSSNDQSTSNINDYKFSEIKKPKFETSLNQTDSNRKNVFMTNIDVITTKKSVSKSKEKISSPTLNYKEIEYIQANDSFELELQGDNSKYLNLAHYMLKNMPDLLVSEWANYIIDLNLFLSKDESKKVVGRKLLKELGENTRDERLIVRIRKWFLQ